MPQTTPELTILSAKAATGAGNNIDVEGFRMATIIIASAGTATLTVKLTGTTLETAPDFTASRTVAVRYEYLAGTDVQSGSAVAGDTGIAFAGADDVRMLQVDVRGLKWITAVVTAYTAGNVSVFCKLYV